MDSVLPSVEEEEQAVFTGDVNPIKLIGFTTCITITRTIWKPGSCNFLRKFTILIRIFLMFCNNSLRATVFDSVTVKEKEIQFRY